MRKISQKLSDGTGSRFENLRFPLPRLFFRAAQWPRAFCGGPWLTTAMRPSCLQDSQISRSQNGQQHAGLLLESSQVKLGAV